MCGQDQNLIVVSSFIKGWFIIVISYQMLPHTDYHIVPPCKVMTRVVKFWLDGHIAGGGWYKQVPVSSLVGN